MKKSFVLLLLLLFVFLFSSVCFAKNSGKGKKPGVSSGAFEFNLLNGINQLYTLNKKTYITGNIQVRWKLWPFLGEPVEHSVASWELNSIGIRNEKGMLTEYFACKDETACNDGFHIPYTVMKKVRIYGLKIQCRVTSNKHQTSAGYIVDPGVMASPFLTINRINGEKNKGRNSFNAPGSPSWKEFFIHHGNSMGVSPTSRYFYKNKEDGNYYANESYAKKLLKSDLGLQFPEIVEMKIDSSAVRNWLAKKERKKREAELLIRQKKERAELEKKKKMEEREGSLAGVNTSKKRKDADKSPGLSDFENDLFSQNKNAKDKKKNFLDDSFAEQLDAGLQKAELNLKFSKLFLALENKHKREKQVLIGVFNKKTSENQREKQEADDYLLSQKNRIDNYVMPTKELIPYYQSGKGYGYKDPEGKVVIKPQFISAKRFKIINNRFALVQIDLTNCDGTGGFNTYALINKKGKQVTPAFIYYSFPTKKSVEISVVTSFEKPRKVYVNKAKDNLTNEYLEWEYQTRLTMSVITYDENMNRTGSRSVSEDDSGHWYWLEKCFGIKENWSYD